jgi:RNA polymerase sigma-70 factor (ECF subfamily)
MPLQPGVQTYPKWSEEAAADPDLWGRLSTGDEAAFRLLFARHRDAVYNYAFRRTASWSTAEDVAQATFLALWRRALRGGVEPLQLDSARPVLLAMARNECHNAGRKRMRSLRLVDAVGKERTVNSDNVNDWLEAETIMGKIRRALSALPADQRDVVELVAWSELSLAEAAAVLGVPLGTVKSRLSRARERLRDLGHHHLGGEEL